MPKILTRIVTQSHKLASKFKIQGLTDESTIQRLNNGLRLNNVSTTLQDVLLFPVVLQLAPGVELLVTGMAGKLRRGKGEV